MSSESENSAVASRQADGPVAGDSSAGLMARRVELILAQLESLPTLSPVATRLLRLSSNDGIEEADFEEVIRLIEADPSLSARMLSLSRRASLGVSKQVTTVRRAVVLLGLEAVQSSLLGIQVYELLGQDSRAGETRTRATRVDSSPLDSALWGMSPADSDAPGFDRVGFWEHSVAVASCAELLAEGHRELRVHPGEAFTAGLMHDLGKLVLDWLLPKSYEKVIALARARGWGIAPAERAVLGLDHHIVGKRLGEHWGLPHVYQDAMWLHGQPMGALPEVRHRGLIGLVTLADAMCRSLHLGWSGSCEQPGVLGQDAGGGEAGASALAELAAELGLRPERVRDVVPRLHEAVARRGRDLGLNEQAAPQLVVRSIAQANERLARLAVDARAKTDLARRQQRVMDATIEFMSRSRAGASLTDVLAQVAQSFNTLSAGEAGGFCALVSQTRESGPWRLCRYERARALWCTDELPAPKDAAGQTLDLAALVPCSDGDGGAAGDAGVTLGPTIALITWLSEHMDRIDASGSGTGGAGTPDVRTLQVLPLRSGVGPVALLVHDQAGLSATIGRRGIETIGAVWGGAIASAAQHDGARRLGEQFAETSRRLVTLQDELTRTRSMARLGELTAGAAHELNNPLAVISGRAQMLQQRLRDPKDKDDAAQIAQAAGRLSDLITRLHLVSRAPELKLEAMDPGEVLREGIRQGLAMADLAPGTVCPKPRVVVGAGAGPAMLDRALMSRVIAELVANACQAGPRKFIEVGARVDDVDDQLILWVRDDGPGLSEHALEHAFDPFFSEKKAGRRQGLGLSMAQKIAQAHKGRVNLRSEPGKGAMAEVALRSWRAGAQVAAPAAGAGESGGNPRGSASTPRDRSPTSRAA